MVKKSILLLLITLVCLASLTGCKIVLEVISLSPFPGYLSQAVAAVYVGHEISGFLDLENDRWWSDVYVLRRRTDEEDFVFLVVKRDYGGQRVYAFDDSLALKSFAEVDHHNDLHLVEADGRFFVGDVHFDPDTLTATTDDPPLNLWGHAFSGGGSNYLLWADGTNISIEPRSASDWSSSTPYSVSIEDPGYGYVPYRLLGIGHEPFVTDMEISDFPVYLFFYNWEHDYVRVVKTSEGAYSPLALNDPLVPYYPYTDEIHDVKDNFFCYTRKGFVASAHNDGLFYRLSFQGERSGRLWVSKDYDTAVDFDLAGEYFYCFDPEDLRLYKCVTGW